jgi:hypothetical protein
LLQYKRPTLWYGATAPLFAVYHTPYYRFKFKTAQHRTLVRLDEALLDEAIVRYAAPCTIDRKELEQWQIDRVVLENTNFVSPRRIGLRHRAWTYSSPATVGYRNEFTPDDDSVASDSANVLFGYLTARPQALVLNEHLSLVLRRLGGSEADAAVERNVSGLNLDDEASRQAIAALTRLRLIGLELAPTGVSWWLLQIR